MMRSVFMVAALLAAASKGLETTYTAEFVSPQAFAQGSESFNETTVNVLESSEITVVSTSFDGTKYSFTIEEETSGSIGYAYCDFLNSYLSGIIEACFIDGISMGETVLCTVSSFDNYAEQCTSDVSSRYYLESPLASSTPIEQFDAFIMRFYSDTLVRYVSSEKNDTHYTVDVTESYKDQFANMFCLGTSVMPDPGKLCAVGSLSDGNLEYCKPSENAACQPHDSAYEIMYPALLAAKFDKDTLDGYASDAITILIQNGYSATFISSSNLPSQGIYTVFVNESDSGYFGAAFGRMISNNENIKCLINEVVDYEYLYYSTPDECFADVEYSIKFHPAVAPLINTDQITAQIEALCDMINSNGLGSELVSNLYAADNATYTFTVNEQLPGFVGSVYSDFIEEDSTLKCVTNEMSSGDIAYYTTPSECFTEFEYKIEFLSAAAPQINPDDITAQIQEICEAANASGVKTEFVSKSYDVYNAIYTFTVKEVLPGAFGNVTAEAIKSTEIKCLIKKISDSNGVEYLAFNGDECYFTTVYELGFSMNTPDAIDKAFMDGLMMPFVDGETLVYVDSNITGSLYTITIKELQEGYVSEVLCSILPGFVTMKSELCYITFIKYGSDEVQCTPRVDDYCSKIDPGVTTLYEVKYYGNMSTKEELDAFFEAACEYARSASHENIKFANSTYSEKTYNPIIVEPVTGIFGNHFCRYISDNYKCDFGSLRAGGNDYCNNPECSHRYTLTFLDGSEVVMSEELEYDDKITYPALKKPGFLLTWDSNVTRMPMQDLNISAVWVEGTKFVEVVLETDALEKEDLEKLVKMYTNDTFAIEGINTGDTTGEVKVTIKFNNKEEAVLFVETIKESDESSKIIKSIDFVEGDSSYSPSLFIDVLSLMTLLVF